MALLLPELFPIRQTLPGSTLYDVGAAMEQALSELDLERRVTPGMRIGIPAGSRGICQIPLLLRVVVEHVRKLGADPLVVPAMGSHGGGTEAGQLAVLESLGITPESLGAPVIPNTTVEVVATLADRSPVVFDRVLAGCDGLLVINRVKPHTSFCGALESGLTKMLVVGCGKAQGARAFHAVGALRLSNRLEEAGKAILSTLPVLGGIAVLENGREEIAELAPVRPESWLQKERVLLSQARNLLPRLPVDELDLLIVEEMGKDIAGTGMDTNVIGRMGIRGVPDVGPKIERIVVLDLTEGSHGNANGMGLADIVPRRFLQKVDFQATYLNTLTATFLERAKLPVVLETDREAIEAALRSLGDPSAPRIMRIRNTLELDRTLVSSALLKELEGKPHVTREGESIPWRFDPNGNLLTWHCRE